MKENLAPITAQAIWSSCLLGYWGAFRLGELFPPDSRGFDRNSGLLWEDVEFEGQTVKLHIRSAKVPGSPGNLAVIFPVRSKKLCPVVALHRLHASQRRVGLGDGNLPVFRKASGKCITKRFFLDSVNPALEPTGVKVGGKSFRSGIPSELENFPREFKESPLKALGRWKGSSYQSYMRNDLPEFRWVFEKVANLVLKDFVPQGSGEDDPDLWTGSSGVKNRTGKPTRKGQIWKPTIGTGEKTTETVRKD